MSGLLLRSFLTAGLLASTLALMGCSGGGSPISAVTSLFEKEEVPLTGQRVSVLSVGNGGAAEVESKEPVVLPQPQQNAGWSQPGGVANNAPGHLAYAGSGAQAWKGDAGS